MRNNQFWRQSLIWVYDFHRTRPQAIEAPLLHSVAAHSFFLYIFCHGDPTPPELESLYLMLHRNSKTGLWLGAKMQIQWSCWWVLPYYTVSVYILLLYRRTAIWTLHPPLSSPMWECHHWNRIVRLSIWQHDVTDQPTIWNIAADLIALWDDLTHGHGVGNCDWFHWFEICQNPEWTHLHWTKSCWTEYCLRGRIRHRHRRRRWSELNGAFNVNADSLDRFKIDAILRFIYCNVHWIFRISESIKREIDPENQTDAKASFV